MRIENGVYTIDVPPPTPSQEEIDRRTVAYARYKQGASYRAFLALCQGRTVYCGARPNVYTEG